MTLARESDPSYLTTFSPLFADVDAGKKESVLSRVLKKFTGASSADFSSSNVHLNDKDGDIAEECSRMPMSSTAALPFRSTTFAPSSATLTAVGNSLFAPSASSAFETGAAIQNVEDQVADEQSDAMSMMADVEMERTDGRHRNLGTVLHRIKAIAARGTPTSMYPYRDRDFQRYWMPDALAHECYDCGSKFSTFRRRRHCRICGQVFCSKCASQEIAGHVLGFSNSIRMCSFCAQIVLSHRQYSSNDDQGESNRFQLTSSSDSPIPAIFGGQTERVSTPALTRKPDNDASGLSFEQLREIWLEMSHVSTGLELKQHRHRFRVVSDCVSAAEMMDWLLRHGKGGMKARRGSHDKNKEQAVLIGQGLLDYKFVECLTSQEMVFNGQEFALYKLKTVTDELEEVNLFAHNLDLLEHEEPTWLQDIPHQLEPAAAAVTPSSRLSDDDPSPVCPADDMDEGRRLRRSGSLDSQLASLTHLLPPSASSIAPSSDTLPTPYSSCSQSREISEEMAFHTITQALHLWPQAEIAGTKGETASTTTTTTTSSNGNVAAVAAAALEVLFQDKLGRMVQQLQQWEDLPKQPWLALILSLASTVTDHVRPKVRNGADDMDIRHYVHVKKVAGGQPSDSRVIFGVVCSKNVAHRKMRHSLLKPLILLYGSALEYQRPDQLSTLEPIMQQEAQYLRNYVKKISELQPDIVLVERNVSRLAHDYLYEEGITLVSNVKASVMKRLARACGCDKLTVMDEPFLPARLGTCAKFEVIKVPLADGSHKALMVLDGCPSPLGCTVLLTGDTQATLIKVKRILTFVIYAIYNWTLEKALLLEQQAVIPAQPAETPPWQDDDRSQFAQLLQDFQPSVSLLTRLDRPDEKTARLIWSKHLSSVECSVQGKLKEEEEGRVVKMKDDSSVGPSHTWLQLHMTKSVQEASIQRSLAHFRANGAALKMPPPSAVVSELIVRQSVSSPWVAGSLPAGAKSEVPSASVDCLSVYQHQRLSILCSIHTVESQHEPAAFCVSPWILVIDYYGRNDLTLGDYLQSFCFRSQAHCPNLHCHHSGQEHVRRFTSGHMAVSVVVRHLPDNNKNGALPLLNLVTWTWCRLCKEVSPVSVLSDESWSLSFAKYLDLRFHAAAYQRASTSTADHGPSSSLCQHSLTQQHIHFFAIGQSVAAFKMDKIQLRQVVTPTIVLSFSLPQHMPPRQSLIDKVKELAIKGHNVFGAINEHLGAFQATDSDRIHEQLPAFLLLSRTQRQIFRDKLECLQIKLASPLLKLEMTEGEDREMSQQWAFAWDIEDAMAALKSQVTETALIWNSHLADLDSVRRKEERKRTLLKSFQSTPDLTSHAADVVEQPVVPSLAINIDLPSTHHTSFALGVPEMTEEGEEDDEARREPSSVGLRRSATEAVLHMTTPSVPLLLLASQVHSERPVQRPPPRSAPPTSSSHNNSPVVPLPFPPNEHYLSVHDSQAIPVVVYDDDLSSIIAFTLASPDYRLHDHHNTDLQHHKTQEFGIPPHTVLGSQAKENLPRLKSEAIDVKSSSESSKGLSSNATGQPFVDVQFASHCARFYCRLYFAHQFAQLRHIIFPYGEDRFIRSLSRSVAWKALGGKSGSSFTKSTDGRFVLKQMSRLELQSFMEFAPHYFAYMTQAIEEKRVTVLAKIVGVYRVGFRNGQTGAVAKQNLLVMENLFYGRKVQQVYDLKGSLRNRLAHLNGEAGGSGQGAEMVLLDENFLRKTCQQPLYIPPQAKLALSQALSVDTQFLASLYVMDYSLLVGIDEERQELVLGIIDYIRTFTWDKRLEMVVKKGLAIGGGHKVLPTILSPELYRSRFCEAMQRYFLPVPDQWYALTHSTQS